MFQIDFMNVRVRRQDFFNLNKCYDNLICSKSTIMIFYTPLIKIKFCSIFLTKYSMHKTIKTVINNLQDFQILETQLSTPLLIFFFPQ